MIQETKCFSSFGKRIDLVALLTKVFYTDNEVWRRPNLFDGSITSGLME